MQLGAGNIADSMDVARRGRIPLQIPGSGLSDPDYHRHLTVSSVAHVPPNSVKIGQIVFA